MAAANQHAPVWLNVLLTVVVAWYLAKIVWALVPGTTAPVITAPAAPSQPAAARYKPDYSHTDIVNQHLFGESNAGDAPAPVQDSANAPETRLNLQLHGAIMSTDVAKAHAIISEGGKDSEVYFISDAIPGGAKLHRVYADRVILNRGGVLETLRLPEVAQGGITSAPKSSGTVARRRSFGPRTVRDSFEGDNESSTMASFTKIVRPQPYMPDGELKGYRLYPGRDRKRFAALGLRPGDLVTDINGISLTNINEGMELFKTLGDASQVTITVERNGQTQIMNLDTSQLDLKDERR